MKFGHKTFQNKDGTFRHEPLSESEAKSIMEQIKATDAKRKELMPDEDSAIAMLFNAYIRLKDFGWNDAIYCPKDGQTFKALEAGSTGKHDCIYTGEWPSGSCWILSDDDMYPSHPIMYKAKK